MATQTPFRPQVFQDHLATKYIGRKILCYPEVTSTMDVAKNDCKGSPPGSLIQAEHQTQGRGREGRKWVSNPKENLYFTILLEEDSALKASAVNLCVPIAVVKSIQEYNVPAAIKWPNDVWVNQKKIAGMLIDCDVTGSKFSLAVGVGININEEMDSAELGQSSTSLFMETKTHIDREVFLAKFCNHLEMSLNNQYEYITNEYNSFHMLKEGTVVVVMPKKFEDKSTWYEAISQGVETKEEPYLGYLKVQKKDNGEVTYLSSEEVSVRPYLDSLPKSSN